MPAGLPAIEVTDDADRAERLIHCDAEGDPRLATEQR
jgi:hypothetical protein